MTFRKSKVTSEFTQLYRFRKVSFYALFLIKPITLAGSILQNVRGTLYLALMELKNSELGNLKVVAKNFWILLTTPIRVENEQNGRRCQCLKKGEFG